MADPGYSAIGDKLYVFGGVRDGAEQDGLYVVDLPSLFGERMDAGAADGPGPRSGVALYYDPNAYVVYLFGGSAAGTKYNDLWEFDLQRRTWTQVSAQGAEGAPPAMDQAILVVSSQDGAISVVSGPQEGDAPEPFWQLRNGQWQTSADLQFPYEE